MVYFFRGLAIITGIYLVTLALFGGSAGMLPIWGIIFVGAVALSFKRVKERICSKWWFKLPVALGLAILIVTEGCILYHSYLVQAPEDTNYIIVLGAKVNPTGPSMELCYRLDAAYDYLHSHPEVKAVLSGGQRSEMKR